MDDARDNASPLRIAIVAAEASGDVLGAGLIEAVKAVRPDAKFFGVAGPRMRAAGCEAWYQAEDISVMGLAEVLPHLARLLRLRAELGTRIIGAAPDVFVGIDSPAFNLRLARRIRRAGVPTIQYVSPQVWAWRQSRVREIRESCDRVLCLLPFEPAFYRDHGVAAAFVGHPLADEIPLVSDRAAARRALGLPRDGTVLALLPGSRGAEVDRLAEPFLRTARWLERRHPGLRTVVATANERIAGRIGAAIDSVPLAMPPVTVTGRARDVIAAADAVLTASGTAALETLLVARPMVVAYRMTAFSYTLVRLLGVAKLPHYSLPNLLAGREVAREFVQSRVRPEILGPALEDCLAGGGPAPDWADVFRDVHIRLQGGGSAAAAREVLAVAAAS